MIKKILSAIYSAFISIVLITIFYATWTGYAVIFQPTKSAAIISVIQDIYEGQKLIILDFIDLSKLLVNDTRERIVTENKDSLIDSELMTNSETNFLPSESSIDDQYDKNPLDIVIESSLPDERETSLSENVLEPMDNEKAEVQMNELELGSEMN